MYFLHVKSFKKHQKAAWPWKNMEGKCCGSQLYLTDPYLNPWYNGGFNPFETYYIVKLDHETPARGLKS